MNDFGAPFAAHHGDGEPFMADGGDAGTPFTAPGGDGAAFVGYEHIIRSERSLGAIRLYIPANPARRERDIENLRRIRRPPDQE